MSTKIASLYAEISADTSKLQSGLQSTQTSLKGLTSSFAPAIAGASSFAAAAGVVVKFLKQSLDAAAASERSFRTLSTTWVSTGRAADMSVRKVSEFADQLYRISSLDDEDILDAYNALAKYESIPTDKMEDIVRIAGDMSQVLGGDLAGNAEMLGRVLETGTIPRTWGFSQALKDQIGTAIDAGDKTGALALIMEELTRRYGGQALTALTTYTGATDALKSSVENLTESVGGKYIDALTMVKLLFADSVDALTELATARQADASKTELSRRTTEQLTEALANVDEQIASAKGRLEAAALATARLAIQEELASRKSYDFGDAADALNASLGLQLETTGALTSEVQDYSDRFSAVLDLTDQYVDYAEEVSALEGEIAEKRKAGYSETGKTITDLKGQIEQLQEANNRQTAAWISNLMLQQLSVDGLSSAEMAFMLDYQINTGLITADAATRAQAMYDEYLRIMDVYASIPDGKSVTVDFILGASPAALASVGAAVPYQVGGARPTQRAAGGPLPLGQGWAEVGEMGAEGISPSGYVVPAHKWSAMKRAGLVPSRHYALGNLPMEDQAIGRMTSKHPVAASSYNPFTGMTYSERGWSDPSGTTMMPGVTTFSPPAGGGNSAINQVLEASASSSAAVETVSQAAEQISTSGRATTEATKQGTQEAARGNAMMIEELRALRRDIKQIIPKAIRDGYQSVVGQ